jgi:hypothetical protein
MEEPQSFEYVHLDQIDPSFTPIDDDFYTLKILSAERREYDVKPGSKAYTGTPGQKGEYINFGFAVTDSAKFAGRRVYESLFPNGFTFKVMRNIQDAVGISQNGDTTAWLAKLSTVQPLVKLKVAIVPDVNRDGTPNPKTAKTLADGTVVAGNKNVIDWKSGVQPVN